MNVRKEGIVMRCPQCNSKLNSKNKFCPECGLTVVRENEFFVKESGANRREMALIIILVLAAVIFATAALFLFNKMHYYKKLAEVQETVTQEKAVPELSFPDDPEAIAAAAQSVMKLKCYDRSGELTATGSGFACFADNVIVTNHALITDHVYRVEVYTENGKMFEVSHVLASDEGKNIAILTTAEPNGAALLQQGKCDALQKGDTIVAIGNLKGTKGSFDGYMIHNNENVLHFTAQLSGKSSGGALLNDAGEVVGMTFSPEEDQNQNLAIPIEMVEQLYSNQREPVTMDDWYRQHTKGYEDFLNSTVVKFSDLVSNPKKYNGMLISVEGYVATAFEEGTLYGGDICNRLYLIPSRDSKTWKDESTTDYYMRWLRQRFSYTKMIRCDDLTHSIDMVEYIDDNVYVTGVFEYDRESASMDVRYVGQE